MADYVDNTKFYEKIKEYKIKYEAGERPQIPDYIGECFLKIAKNLSNHVKFINYSFKEDMVSNAIFDCIRYAHNFDYNRTKNPFGYFTQVAWFAFLRTIKKEKKDMYIKYKVLDNSEVFNSLHSHFNSDDMLEPTMTDIGYSEGSREKMRIFIENYEKK